MESDRLQTLDVLRGVAVMGILLMNIIAFAMPESAYINPSAWGGMTGPDIFAWAASFILVDSKMRSLFSILFGASMILFIDRAEAREADAKGLHFRRMMWLFVFGYLHFLFIWNGDILTLYAAMGGVAWFWRELGAHALFRRAGLLLGAAFLLWGSILGGVWSVDQKAHLPIAKAKDVQSANRALADLGAPGSKSIKKDLARYRSGYGLIFVERATDKLFSPISMIFIVGFETLGLMALGMALLKNGFLSGQMSSSRYRQVALFTLGLSIPAMCVLAGIAWASGFSTLLTASLAFLWSLPFRAPMAVGYAALIILGMRKLGGGRLVQRLAATGQAAFTNYLGTSLVMTTIFYGYGFGFYGTVSRWQLYLVVPVAWMVMLLWSKPWMDRYRHGPLEWLWRCLTRWELAPLRRV